MQSTVDESNGEPRLACLCRGVAEAAWLAVAIGVPLLFDPRAVTCGYQPVKLGLFRALALIALAAWLVHTVETSGWRRCLAAVMRHRLFQALAVLAVVVVASTALSVEWRSSLLGAYETAQGAWTWAAGLVMLGIVARFLRTQEQAERLVTALLVTSFAVSMISLLQRAGYDPQVLFFGGGRAFSSLGNPIYLGGYLLMVVPLTVWRMTRQRTHWQRLFYALLLLSQSVALYFSASRGPSLGLAAGLFLFAALYVAKRRMRGLQMLLGGIAVAVCVAALAALMLASPQRLHGTSTASVSVPLIGSDSGRSHFWAHAPKIIMGQQPLQYPNGEQDRLAWLRPWLGHGLDTLDRVIVQHRAGGDGAATENRFHNLALDHAFTLGLAGLVSFLAVLLLTFRGGFERLGLIRNRHIAIGFWTCVLGSGAVVGLVAVLALGAGFTGLGLVLGLAAGVLLFAVWGSLFVPSPPDDTGPGSDAWLLVAVLSALAGHLVDMAFAFETAATFALLFVFLGLVHALQRGLTTISQPTPAVVRAVSKKARRQAQVVQASPVGWRQAFAVPLIVAFGLVTLLFTLTHEYSFEAFSAGDLLSFSLLNLKGQQGHYSLMLLPVLAFWAAGSVLLGGDLAKLSNLSHRVLIACFGAAILALVYALFESAQIAGLGPIPRRAAEVSHVLAQAQGYADVYGRAMLWLLVLVLAAGACLAQKSTSAAASSWRGWVGLGCATAAVVLALGPAAFGPLRNDAMAQWGMTLENFGRTRLASEMYVKAIEGHPRIFAYRALLVDNWLREAEDSSDAQAASALLRRAEQVMLDARRWTALDRSSYYLGLIYRQLALLDAAPAASPYATKADAALVQARIFEPLWEPAWRESALVEQRVLGNPLAATAKFAKARQLGKTSALFWAETYAVKAPATRHPEIASHYATAALEYFDTALTQAAEQPELLPRLHSGRGKLLLALGRFLQAIPSLQEALKHDTLTDRWQVELMLVQAHLQIPDPDQARQHLEQALKLAPPEQREELRPYQEALGIP